MSIFVSACPQTESTPDADSCRCRQGDAFVQTMTHARLRACLAAQLTVASAHDSAFGACRICGTGEGLPCPPAAEAFAHAMVLVDELRRRLAAVGDRGQRS